MILLEDVIDITNKIPTCIIDLRVLLFEVLSRYKKVEGILIEDSGKKQDWFTCMWVKIFNDPIPWLRKGKPTEGYNVIVVDDTKDPKTSNYWRNGYLEERGYPTYKGNRKVEERPPEYYQLHEKATSYLNQENCKIPLLKEVSFEADDFAGLCVGVRKPSDNPMFLLTVDTDWSQLVNDEKNVLFYSTRNFAPRLRSEHEVLMWAKKKGWVIKNPKELVDIKSEYGDASDALIPGSPKEVIDLCEPPLKPSIDLKWLTKKVNNHSNNTNKEHLNLANKWLMENSLD